MTKTLNIPNRSAPVEIDTDDFEENEIKEMEKSNFNFALGRLLRYVRKSDEFSFDETCTLEHWIRTNLLGSENRAFQNY